MTNYGKSIETAITTHSRRIALTSFWTTFAINEVYAIVSGIAYASQGSAIETGPYLTVMALLVVLSEGMHTPEEKREIERYENAGVTWWLEDVSLERYQSVDEVRIQMIWIHLGDFILTTLYTSIFCLSISWFFQRGFLDFVSKLVQKVDPAHPALRLSFSIGRHKQPQKSILSQKMPE